MTLLTSDVSHNELPRREVSDWANTTTLLQPMDQQVIPNLKKFYTKAFFERFLKETEGTRDVPKESFVVLFQKETLLQSKTYSVIKNTNFWLLFHISATDIDAFVVPWNQFQETILVKVGAQRAKEVLYSLLTSSLLRK
ncbi:hypothetical protein AVEN_136959-1 [Araneus ventricosus]|uniref:Uncharacterized protein n=1 Tax=Araneus ventricosus TaxID=182803 RepID=A0A4Y2BJR2_ARAVE|nr:hypothetical protein AVEN_136959-1 [Araneus ventricosus]